jgi:hypothetical protein
LWRAGRKGLSTPEGTGGRWMKMDDRERKRRRDGG